MTVSNRSAVLAEQKQEECHRQSLKTVKYAAEDKWWLVCCKEINSVDADESQLKGEKEMCGGVHVF